jgi:hypothetical protein
MSAIHDTHLDQQGELDDPRHQQDLLRAFLRSSYPTFVPLWDSTYGIASLFVKADAREAFWLYMPDHDHLHVRIHNTEFYKALCAYSIYGVADPKTFYFEVIESDAGLALWAKYQQILGGRLLCYLCPDELAAWRKGNWHAASE